jgi:AbrB family looped-hinge helix DNA binding protein
MKSTVSQKGQVVIPKPLRDRLGIKAGQVLDFHEERGLLVAAKVTAEDPVDRVYGVLRLGASTDRVMTRLRGKADPR